MKKLIELGHTQATIIEKILKEEWLYKPKEASKYILEKKDIDAVHSTYYLCIKGKLDSTHFGCIMYRLGLEMNSNKL